ncbi:phage protein NinX family protein [Massilia pseudoviolaceinigra]|uniref:phage protein NinX family protein n=1 Tax=Massilia pseudoviolaceinigra TaxID=3057165 RepID=UPI0035B5404F
MDIPVLVSNLLGADLDYWIARACGTPPEHLRIETVPGTDSCICIDLSGPIPTSFDPSTNWDVGGPIIKAVKIGLAPPTGLHGWQAFMISRLPSMAPRTMFGATPLIASMRAYVASIYGDIVYISTR